MKPSILIDYSVQYFFVRNFETSRPPVHPGPTEGWFSLKFDEAGNV